MRALALRTITLPKLFDIIVCMMNQIATGAHCRNGNTSFPSSPRHGATILLQEASKLLKTNMCGV